jgi:hypothetical protein
VLIVNELKKFRLPRGIFPRPSVIVAVMILGTFFPSAPLGASLAVFALAFVQNTAYSLQSRAGNRTSNLYHFISAVFATTVFFVSLSFLVHLKVTLGVLLVYILGTMLGSVYGVRLSVRIERIIGAVAELGAEAKDQSLPLSRAVPGLLAILAIQVLMLVSVKAVVIILAVGFVGAWAIRCLRVPDGALRKTIAMGVIGMLSCAAILVYWGDSLPERFSVFEKEILLALGIAGAAFIANVLFSSLRIARSTDAYWFHLVLVLIHAVAGFTTYGVLVKANGNWFLFAPYLTAAILGSLLGAEWGKRIGASIGASWQARKIGKGELVFPRKQTALCLALFIPHFAYFGYQFSEQVWIAQSLTLGAALLQNSAFTVVSRARQRNHELYLEWASVFSNGIWFLTLSVLVFNDLSSYLLIPYLVGTGIGSLWGQNFAIALENKIGATMESTLKKG